MSGRARAGLRSVVARLPPPARVALARGLWRARDRRGRPGLPVPRGAAGRDDRPGVLVVALGLDANVVGRLADAVAGAQRRTGARVMLVVDTDAFAHLRAHDLPFEYIPPRGDWDAQIAVGDTGSPGGRIAHPQGGYDRFLADRLVAILAVYRPERVLAASAAAGLPAPVLDALLS